MATVHVNKRWDHANSFHLEDIVLQYSQLTCKTLILKYRARSEIQLVRDCIIYGLNEHESMAYMKKRAGGIPFSRSYYYVIKKRVSEKESSTSEDRLTEHIRVGFALNHFNYIRSIEYIQKILFQTLVDECSKTPEHRNLFAISLGFLLT